MPMPRLTYAPSCNSSEARCAICSRLQGMVSGSPCGALCRTSFDAFFGVNVEDETLHEDSRRMDEIGVEFAGGDDLFDLGDGDFTAGGGEGIEVARRLAIDE